MTGRAQCCGFAPAFSNSAGQDGPLLYPGPLCGGESGTTGRAAGEARDGLAFSRGQDARSKSPAPAHGLAGQESGKRQAGWPFSLVTFSLLRASCPPPFGPASPFACAPAHAWPRKEKVTRLPKADESSCSEVPVHRTRASRASALLQGHASSCARAEVRLLPDQPSAVEKRLAGMTSERQACLRRPAQGARFNANTAFNPPNANELLSTARTGISRATFGT